MNHFTHKSGVTYASCLCFLPLTKLSISSLEAFCLFSFLYSAHNSEMLFKIKQHFSSEALQSFLLVCVFVLTQCMNIDKTNCAAQWIFTPPPPPCFTHLLDTQAFEHYQTQVSKLILGAVSQGKALFEDCIPDP